jgi:predicted phage terminase large subunit-like protein
MMLKAALEAQVVIIGGAAGSGKSYILQLIPLFLVDDGRTTCRMFRRTTPQIKGQGGIWDTGSDIYLSLPTEQRPRKREQKMEFIWPNGARVDYSHMERVSDKLNIQGLQFTFIGVDEATQFEWEQLEYMMSRLRSSSSHHSRMVMSCNPDPDHKIRELIDWYLDEEGYPIPERDGKIRYFIKIDGDFVWGDTSEELIEKFGEDQEPTSFTFVSGTIYDNPVMIKNNPSYLSFLKGLNPTDRAQLLDGNWDVKAEGANYFKRENLGKLDSVPLGRIKWARGWDTASQEITTNNKDPDFTAGTKMGKCKDGYYYIVGQHHPENKDKHLGQFGRFRERPQKRDKLIAKQGHMDGVECTIVLPVDPAAAGKVAYEEAAKRLIAEGLSVKKDPVPNNKNKLTKYTPFADAVEAGLVFIVESTFDRATLEAFYKEHENFDGERSGRSVESKDDWSDSTATVFNFLAQSRVRNLVVRNQQDDRTRAADMLENYNLKNL